MLLVLLFGPVTLISKTRNLICLPLLIALFFFIYAHTHHTSVVACEEMYCPQVECKHLVGDCFVSLLCLLNFYQFRLFTVEVQTSVEKVRTVNLNKITSCCGRNANKRKPALCQGTEQLKRTTCSVLKMRRNRLNPKKI